MVGLYYYEKEKKREKVTKRKQNIGNIKGRNYEYKSHKKNTHYM